MPVTDDKEYEEIKRQTRGELLMRLYRTLQERYPGGTLEQQFELFLADIPQYDIKVYPTLDQTERFADLGKLIPFDYLSSPAIVKRAGRVLHNWIRGVMLVDPSDFPEYFNLRTVVQRAQIGEPGALAELV